MEKITTHHKLNVQSEWWTNVKWFIWASNNNVWEQQPVCNDINKFDEEKKHWAPYIVDQTKGTKVLRESSYPEANHSSVKKNWYGTYGWSTWWCVRVNETSKMLNDEHPSYYLFWKFTVEGDSS